MKDLVTAYFMISMYGLGFWDGIYSGKKLSDNLIRVSILFAWPLVLCYFILRIKP